MSNIKLSDAQERFIEDFAQLLTQWNMPITAARIYAYLQLMPEAVSLDEIAAALGISKSNACTAAKLLEDHGNATRVTERGSRRILYVAADDPGAPLRRHVDLLGRMAGMIAGRSDAIATGAVKARLDALATFDKDLGEAMAVVVSRAAPAP